VLKRQSFDAILMDVQMPEMDGYETTAAIRRDESKMGGHIPIIAMTAYAMKGDRERCLTVGMDRYISKPVRAKELFESVEALPAASAEPGAAREPSSSTAGVLDEAEALSRVGDDRELLGELAEVFLGECPRLLETIRRAIAAGDTPNLKIAAHSLKGAIDNFALQSAYDAALRLEMLARVGNLAEAEPACARLQQEMERLMPAVAGLAKVR